MPASNHPYGRSKFRWLVSCSLVALLAMAAQPAHAQTKTWNAATGNWTTGTNWTPANAPGNLDDAIINNAGTAQLTGSGTSKTITLGSNNGNSGTLSITSSSGLLSVVGTGFNTTIGDFGVGTVSLASGGRYNFNSGTSILGNASTGVGTLNIVGAGSRYFGTGDMLVGMGGSGAVNVTNGGSLSIGALTTSDLTGSTSTMLVDGTGSTLTLSSNATIGSLGTSTVTVSNGAVANMKNVSIGSSANSHGAVNINGGTINATGSVTVGSFGQGTLAISNGGRLVPTVGVTVGNAAGSTGTVTVDGVGSSISGSVVTGNLGTGNLTLSNGAVGTFTGFNISSGAGSHGAVFVQSGAKVTAANNSLFGGAATSDANMTVTGAGSSFTFTNGFSMGAGINTMTVTAAGAVTAKNIATVGDGAGSNDTLNVTAGGQFSETAGALTAGSLSGATGTINVDGAGSKLTMTSTGGVFIGNNGTGALNITGGGAMNYGSGGITVGNNGSATGTATVDGVGSSLTGSGGVTVSTGGNATLNITNGASMATQSFLRLALNAGGNGTLNVNNGTLNVTGALNIGVIGAGTALIEANSSVTSGAMALGGISSNNSTRGSGNLHVDNSRLTTGAATIGNGGTATVLVDNGGDIVSGTTIIGGGVNGSATATSTIDGAGSTWSMGALTVGSTNNGQLFATNGATLASVGGSIGSPTSTGLIEITNSTWNANNAAGTANIGVGAGGVGALNVVNSTVQTSNRLTVGGSGVGGNGAMLLDNSSFTLLPQTATVQPNTVEIGRDGGTGILTVRNGSTMQVNAAQFQLGTRNTLSQGTLIVEGAGTTVATTGPFTVGQNGAGHFLLLDSAVMNTGSFTSGGNAAAIAASDNLIDNATLNITGSGAGVAARLGTGGTTTLTIQNGGMFDVTGGGMDMAELASSVSTLNILNGGGAAGVLNVESITGGAGAATINFDHTDAGYIFAPVMSGRLTLNQLGGGTTILTGDSDFLGATTISDGALQFGNGGATGSIAGDITDNSALIFDRSAPFTYAGLISGGGSVSQIGSGALTFTGANSYLGPTQVNAGALYINGDQSAATGPTSVASGATLGGIGVIGGDVAIADGATLAPGDNIPDPGTLNIDGNLTLSSGSLLSYSFGERNVAGGLLNDLTQVHGNLILDGTINVSVSPGGSFDPGVYRVFSYDGTLTDNGLAVGSIPAPNFFVQTSVANQINLVNTTGVRLNYWDGAAGPKNDGHINGGVGLWQTSAGNDNWTTQDGLINAPFNDGAFAIFEATPGAVTVDNSLGAVTTSGMQFASNGYVVQGDTITLVGSTLFPNAAIIRVGDGTEPGAGYVATINSVLTGGVQLVKVDRGTLILNAANTYSGGTLIRNGVLTVGHSDALGSGAIALANLGVLDFNANYTISAPITVSGTPGINVGAGLTETLTGAITDGASAGALNKSGDGVLILTGADTATGATTISAGVLQIGDGGTSGSIAGPIVDNSHLVINRTDTVTLPGVIGGTGDLTQAGPGTTILANDNTYTGGTTIGAGALQLGNGGTTGSVAGDIVNNAALIVNRSNTYAYTGLISGPGSLTIDGGGTLALSQAQTYTGATNIAMGTLEADIADVIAPTSALIIGPDGVFFQNAFNQTLADIDNAGAIILNREGAAPGVTLTVDPYFGRGGSLVLNTLLAGDGSPSDRLIIDGGQASGNTNLVIRNVNGSGALTTGDGILVVDAINGGAITNGAFALSGGAVPAGPYDYTLHQGGASNVQAWFLRSDVDCADPNTPAALCPSPPPNPPLPNYRPEVSLYTSLPALATLYGRAMIGTLNERVGDQEQFESVSDLHGRPSGWGRLMGWDGQRDGGNNGIYGDRGPSFDYSLTGLQAGFDLYRHAGDNNRTYAGLTLGLGRADNSVTNLLSRHVGDVTIDATSLGAYWTRFADNGAYLDAVGLITWYDASAKSVRLPELAGDAMGYAVSFEGGRPFALHDGWFVEPQAQLVLQHFDGTSGNDLAAHVTFDSADSTLGRLGVRVLRHWTADTGNDSARQSTAWARLNAWHEFSDAPATTFSSADGPVRFQSDVGGTWLQLDGGYTREVSQHGAMFVNAGYSWDAENKGDAVSGRVGFRLSW